MKMFSIFVVAVLALSSCASVSTMQKQDIVEAKMNGTYVEEKNAGLAAGLNVLPGIGDFYNGNVGYGIVNLLTWPLSILWAPIGGYDGALVRNWEESRIYAARKTMTSPVPPSPLAPVEPPTPPTNKVNKKK